MIGLAMTLVLAAGQEGEPARAAYAVFTAKCGGCHAVESREPKARARWERPEDLVRSGLVVRRKPEASPLWQAVRDGAMPPASSKQGRLDIEELGTIERWIRAGAPPDYARIVERDLAGLKGEARKARRHLIAGEVPAKAVGAEAELIDGAVIAFAMADADWKRVTAEYPYGRGLVRADWFVATRAGESREGAVAEVVQRYEADLTAEGAAEELGIAVEALDAALRKGVTRREFEGWWRKLTTGPARR